MHAGTDGRAVPRPGLSKVHSLFSFFSEAQNGLQKFWVVRASAQTPEEVGPREAGEPPPTPLLSVRGPLPKSKTKYTGQLRFYAGCWDRELQI